MSKEYWDNRYKSGIGAGSGSRGNLYKFKLEAVQGFIDRLKVKSMVDVGCGDGGQMMSLKVDSYLGLDISPVAIEAASAYAGEGRQYSVIDKESIAKGKIADMAISLDVLQHLPADQADSHLDLLFRLAKKYVLIYAPDQNGDNIRLASHMHFREFTSIVKEKYGADVKERVANEYPADFRAPSSVTSFSEFFLFKVGSKS